MGQQENGHSPERELELKGGARRVWGD